MELLITLFLCGDVMLGRGVDQVLPYSVDPVLYEAYVQSAETYVALAEQAHGPIDKPVGFSYLWGDALEVLKEVDPGVRLINLETSVTDNGEPWPRKGIHYRMHPANVPALTVAGIDGAVLSNNHVLDWGYSGLIETLAALEKAGVEPVGAGRDAEEAREPVVLTGKGGERVLVFAYGAPSSGIPTTWAAGESRPGVNYLPDLSEATLREVAARIEQYRQPGDVVVFSVHWGGNWGYEIPEEQRRFAYGLIEGAGVDIVHGHSSHHVKAVEVYRGRLVLYGCGDFLNDYEGIGGHEEYRPDLAVMYFPSVRGETGELRELRLVPMQIRRMQLHRAGEADVRWLRDRLNLESEPFGVGFRIGEDGSLYAVWEEGRGDQTD